MPLQPPVPKTTSFKFVTDFVKDSQGTTSQGGNTAAAAVDQRQGDNGQTNGAASFTIVETAMSSSVDTTPVQGEANGAAKDEQELMHPGQAGSSSADNSQSVVDWVTDGFSSVKSVMNGDAHMGEEVAETTMYLAEDSAGEQTNLPDKGDQRQSSPEAPSGAEGHQRQFNKDGSSLNPEFSSRSGRAIKSPDRL